MDDPLKYSNLKKVKFLDTFDILFILIAVAVIASSIFFSFSKPKNRPKFMVKSQLEKELKNLDGIKSVTVEFHNGSMMSVLIEPWIGNYSIYKKENIEKIFYIIEEKSGLPRDNVSLYDKDTGELIEISSGSVFSESKE